MKKSHLLEIALCACCIFASCKETEIFIQPHELHLNVGDNTTITAIVDHGDPADIMWSSPFPSYVSVESSNNAGEAVVTAKMYTPDPITITASIPTESAKADCIVIVDQVASDDTTHTGNDPITITPSSLSLHHGDNETLHITSQRYLSASIGDEYIAKKKSDNYSSPNREIVIEAKYVGSTYLHLSNSDVDTVVPIEVVPEYTTYDEPNLDFDDNRDSVIAKLGTPLLDYDTTMTFYEFSDAGMIFILVLFDDYKKVSSYAVELDETYETEVENFIAERYAFYRYYSGYNFYIDADYLSDATKVIAQQNISSFTSVAYMPASSLQKLSQIEDQVKKATGILRTYKQH